MNKIATVIAILAIIILGGYFLLKGPQAVAPAEQDISGEKINEPVSSAMPTAGKDEVKERETARLVAYADSGYSPNILTIKAGETVTFQNNSAQNMWTASAMHPTHTAYSGTSLSEHCPDAANLAFDACRGILPGESWSFAFSKTGTWGYHDHLHPALFGKIIVE